MAQKFAVKRGLVLRTVVPLTIEGTKVPKGTRVKAMAEQEDGTLKVKVKDKTLPALNGVHKILKFDQVETVDRGRPETDEDGAAEPKKAAKKGATKKAAAKKAPAKKAAGKKAAKKATKKAEPVAPLAEDDEEDYVGTGNVDDDDDDDLDDLDLDDEDDE